VTDQSQPSAVTSQSLLERVRRRSPEAWERMSAIYGPLVYQWARRCNLSNEDAADIVQEVFRTLTHALVDYRPTGKFRGWLWTVTRNKVRDQVRAVDRRAVAAGGTTAYGLLQQRSASEHGVTVRTLDLIRSEFEPSTWQAFWLSTVEKKSGAEIAAALGLTKHAVYQAKYRVTQRLRAELAGLE
jgi:RNA polymerase sigma-70 factor (ECF subfamily)